MENVYRDRKAAGAALADRLAHLAHRPDVVVLGLVRGGVEVAAEVASRLGAPLDVLVVRKLGMPWAPELAFGALGPGGIRVLNEGLGERVSPAEMAEVTQREQAEIQRREQRYRAGRPPLNLEGCTAVIVDDGLATGATARAAVAVARGLGAARVVLAAPVGSMEACATLAEVADETVCLMQPLDFGAVGQFYEDFHEVSDDEVTAVLNGPG